MGACHIIFLKNIYTLTGKDRVPVKRGKCICHTFTDAVAVASILRLAVDHVSGNAQRRIVNKRKVAPACTGSGRERGSNIKRPLVPAVYPVVLIQSQYCRSSVAAIGTFERRCCIFGIANAPGRAARARTEPSNEGLYLEILRCHQRTSNAVQVYPFVPLAYMVSMDVRIYILTVTQSRLRQQSSFQSFRQRFSTNLRPAQYTQAGFRA